VQSDDCGFLLTVRPRPHQPNGAIYEVNFNSSNDVDYVFDYLQNNL
jgi:hypothetical protein